MIGARVPIDRRIVRGRIETVREHRGAARTANLGHAM